WWALRYQSGECCMWNQSGSSSPQEELPLTIHDGDSIGLLLDMESCTLSLYHNTFLQVACRAIAIPPNTTMHPFVAHAAPGDRCHLIQAIPLESSQSKWEGAQTNCNEQVVQ
ncbi:unnamed protein product, partial [Chrysoparadoxa australica]